METNNEEQFVEFDEILNFIHENTGFDKEVIEKVLDAETRFLLNLVLLLNLKNSMSGVAAYIIHFRRAFLLSYFLGVWRNWQTRLT